jgi:uncharacterized membrane protein
VSLTVEQTHQKTIHLVYLLHAAFLAGTVPLFLGAMLSDIAYSATYHIQWSNFASWLIVGGLVFGAVAVLFATIDLFRTNYRALRPLVHTFLLLATWILGFINALTHAKDAWAAMPTGLVLSVIVAALACAATWVGFANLRWGGEQ